MAVRCGTPLENGAHCHHPYGAHAMVPPFRCLDWRPGPPAIEGEMPGEEEPCPCPGWSPQIVGADGGKL
jgi:hypothetical protein